MKIKCHILLILTSILFFGLSNIYSQTNKLVPKYYTVFDLNKMKRDINHEIPNRLIPKMRSLYTLWISIDSNGKEKINKIEYLKEEKQILTIYNYDQNEKLISEESYLLTKDSKKLKHGWFYTFSEGRSLSGKYYENDIPKGWWYEYTSDSLGKLISLKETYYKDGQLIPSNTKEIQLVEKK